MPSAARKPATRSSSRARSSGPLVISIGRQSDGCVYGLDVLSRARLQELHPGAHRVPVVFVGYGSKQEFEALHRPMWPQIAQMLTGLSPRRLRELGGVELHDPDDGGRVRVL
jgi:hypothetical protein